VDYRNKELSNDVHALIGTPQGLENCSSIHFLFLTCCSLGVKELSQGSICAVCHGSGGKVMAQSSSPL